MVGSIRCWWHSSNSAFHKRLCFWYGTRYENLASCYTMNNDYDGIFNGSLVDECVCVRETGREGESKCASVRCILLPSGLLLFCVFSNFASALFNISFIFESEKCWSMCRVNFHLIRFTRPVSFDAHRPCVHGSCNKQKKCPF